MQQWSQGHQAHLDQTDPFPTRKVENLTTGHHSLVGFSILSLSYRAWTVNWTVRVPPWIVRKWNVITRTVSRGSSSRRKVQGLVLSYTRHVIHLYPWMSSLQVIRIPFRSSLSAAGEVHIQSGHALDHPVQSFLSIFSSFPNLEVV